jgi:hypothetical protein
MLLKRKFNPVGGKGTRDLKEGVMDKTLKILLACLAIAAMAIFIIPSGDPLTSAPPANPAAPGTPAQSGQEGVTPTAGPEYVPPKVEDPMPNNPPGTADSSDLQQSTFGQPMFDPRPVSEQQADRNRAERSEQSEQPEQIQPSNSGQPGIPSNVYTGPAQGYAQPANNLGYNPEAAADQ